MPRLKISTEELKVITDRIISDTGSDTVARRKVCSVLMRQKGLSYKQIGDALGVTDVCIYGYINPGRRTDTNRHTMLGTTIDGKSIVLTGLHKREYTRVCELCGKGPRKRLYYHHWLDDFPWIGMWLCFKCHMLAESIDEKRDMLDKYLKLKAEITVECLSEL